MIRLLAVLAWHPCIFCGYPMGDDENVCRNCNNGQK